MTHTAPRGAAGGNMAGGLTVAEKPKGKRAKRPAGDGTKWTTFRIYGDDGDELGDLAKEEARIIADTYREHLAPIVKQLLIEKTREKLKKLEGK